MIIIIFCWDPTSTQEASLDFIHMKLNNCTISVELKFDASLANVVELFIMRKSASAVCVRSDRNVTKATLAPKMVIDKIIECREKSRHDQIF